MRKKAGILFLFKIIKIPLSILLLSLTAKYFGVSVGREVWLLAFSTMMAIDTAFWGPVNESFRAKFIFIKEEEGEKKAINYTQSLLSYIFLFSIVIMTIIMFVPQLTALIIAPKYNSDAFELLKTMLIYAAPILLFNQAILIGNSILNAYEVFFVPEISGFINIFINIILIILLTPFLGVYALLVSYFISIIINMAFIVFYIYKTRIPLFTTHWNLDFSGFKMYFIYSLPLFFGYFLGQVSSLTERSLATTLGVGAVAIMDYANRLPTMMYAIVISMISTILLPILAESYAKKNSSKYIIDFQNIYQIGFLLLGFVVVLIFGSSGDIMTILYQSTSILPTELAKIILLAKYYSCSLLGMFLYTIFGMSMMASSENKRYAVLGIISMILMISFNFTFVRYFNIFTFPISTAVAHIIGAFFMYKRFPYKNNNIIKISIKYFSFIFISSIVIIFIKNSIATTNHYINIIVLGVIQIIVMTTLMFLMKIEELQLAINRIKGFTKK